jgi:hypothetical protein
MYVNDHWYLVDIGGRVQTFKPFKTIYSHSRYGSKLGTRQNGWPYPVEKRILTGQFGLPFRYGIAPRPAFGASVFDIPNVLELARVLQGCCSAPGAWPQGGTPVRYLTW